MNKVRLIFFLVLCMGCSTMGTKLTDEHARTHNIEIQITKNNKKHLKYIDVSHRLHEEKVYLTLSGSVRRPFGTLASQMKINAKFMDDKGQIITEKNDKVLFHRAGGRTQRRYEGSFSVRIPDNSDIIKCVLQIG